MIFSASIKGTSESEAVLCTETNTYVLRLVESSNSLLLLDNNNNNNDNNLNDNTQQNNDDNNNNNSNNRILANFSCHYELVEVRPQFQILESLLSQGYYSGSSNENDNLIRYTFEELKGIVQSSENQLKEALQQRGAFELNGIWSFPFLRLIDMSII